MADAPRLTLARRDLDARGAPLARAVILRALGVRL